MSIPDEKVDAVVIGSGAAGSAIAAKLAAGGKQVVILEAGPERGNEDLISSAIWASNSEKLLRMKSDSSIR